MELARSQQPRLKNYSSKSATRLEKEQTYQQTKILQDTKSIPNPIQKTEYKQISHFHRLITSIPHAHFV